jgi:hypothetical protein
VRTNDASLPSFSFCAMRRPARFPSSADEAEAAAAAAPVAGHVPPPPVAAAAPIFPSAAEEAEEDQIIPKPEPDHRGVRVSATVGSRASGWPPVARDGAAAAAWFGGRLRALLRLPDGRVLVSDGGTNLIRMLSADLQQVSTVAGDGGQGYWGRHRDGAALQAQFRAPYGLALLPGGRGVLVVDYGNHRLRLLSADLQQVSTVAGDGGQGHRDGAAAQAQFRHPTGLALLPDGRVLVMDSSNRRIRMLSADLQQVSTVAGDGERGHRDGAAAQAQFRHPTGLALHPDGRVLVADQAGACIRALSADLQQVSTVAGGVWVADRGAFHADGAALAQAVFNCPNGLALLPDGRVLVSDQNNNLIRVLSADLQQVSTLWKVDVGVWPSGAFLALPDGRVLVGGGDGICVLEGFPAALLGPKPSFKRPKKTQQQLQKKRRALAGGASSSGLVPKRSRSGASSSAAAAVAASSSDSEGEEQPGGSAALV